MSLTPAQLLTLKSDMLGASNATLAPLIAANDTSLIAAYYAGQHPSTRVWREDCTPAQVHAVIVWANLTPVDNADGTALYTNRTQICLIKQANLQMMLTPGGGAFLPAAVQTYRDGMQDALTGIPSAVGGTKQGAGFNAVENAMRRLGSRLEVLFSVVQGNASKTDVYGYLVTPNEIADALVA